MKIIYIVHAALGHVSPYMTALKFELERQGCNVKYLASIYDKFEYSEETYVYLHRLGRMYDSNCINSVHAFLNRINDLKKKHIRIVWTIHNFFPLDCNPNEKDLSVILGLASQADYIFAHTRTMQRNAEKMFGREVVNHGYGSDFIFGNNEFNIKRCLPHATTFCFFGNIREYKDMDKLIICFLRLLEKRRNIRLKIIGPDYKGYFKKLCDKYDLYRVEEIEIFNEFVREPEKVLGDVDFLICSYNIFLYQFQFGFYPSSIATLGKYGIPIICPLCESVLDIIQNPQNALLYSVNDCRNNLEAKMNEAINMSESQRRGMAQNLKIHLQKQTWEEVTKSIMRVLGRNMNGN